MVEFISYFNYVEGDLCIRVNRLSHTVWIRRFFAVISRLGDGGFWLITGLALVWTQGLSALPLLLQMGITAAIGVIVYKSLKGYLVRERPYMNHGAILCGTAPLDRYSFPSGHTLHAVSFTAMVSVFEPTLAVIAIPFAILVAASRVILGLHYPSDVVVGAAIGAALASASLAVF